MTAIAPTIGHNSASFIEMIEADPGVVFREKGSVAALYDEIRAEIAAFKPDLTTDKGRKAVAAFAARIVRRKTAIDAAGKELNAELNKQVDAVDAVRRDIRNTLDIFRDQARKPLTEWEAAEEERAAFVERTIQSLSSSCYVQAGTSADEISQMIAGVEAIEIDPKVFGVREPVATKEKARALASLAEALTRAAREAEERAELDRLRAEQEAREKREAEERAAREKAEAETRAAEEMNRREEEAAKRAAEAAAAAERARAEQAANEERRKHEEALAAERRERERLEAEARQAAERAEREAAEAAKREADKAHRGKVMGAAKTAIMGAADVDEDRAKKIVLAIVAGEIPNVTLRF
jgi:hypothetical protein